MKVLITSDWYITAINGVVTSILTLKNDKKENNNELEKRLGNCEKKIEKIYKHLTSFVGDE